MDKEKITQGVRLILEGIGEDVQREGLLETPERIYRMYEELVAGYQEQASLHLRKRFHTDQNDMVMEKGIPFYSFCDIICCRFMVQLRLLMYQMEKWLD